MTQTLTRLMTGHPDEVAPGVFRVRTGISNAYLVVSGEAEPELPESGGSWVLIDAGAEGYGRQVLGRALEIFGDVPPAAVLLTHGHFDHAGGVPELLGAWDVPVYAHRLERPYLNRHVSYPPGDPTVRGFMPELSRFMRTSRPIDVPVEVKELPADGTVPYLEGWRWVATPGHTPGHVSFYDPRHGTLVAGDAVSTMNPCSPLGTLTMRRELSGPPAYATYDWVLAGESVRKLAELRPLCLAPGHGKPMGGAGLAEALAVFAERFRPPRHGRYVRQPVLFDENGPRRIPEAAWDPVKWGVLAGATLASAAGLWWLTRRKKAG